MNKFVCMECFEVYDKDKINYNKNSYYSFCPKSNCDGAIVEIDELMIPIIIELNKKGYNTEFCCSGHCYEDLCNGYIKFEEDIELPSIPKGWKMDEKVVCIPNVTIRFEEDRELSENEKYKKIAEANLACLKWAQGLEYNEC